jgi:hypothetical protein
LVYDRRFAGSAPENYQRYFVPSIGHPVAEDLIEAADIQTPSLAPSWSDKCQTEPKDPFASDIGPSTTEPAAKLG